MNKKLQTLLEDLGVIAVGLFMGWLLTLAIEYCCF